MIKNETCNVLTNTSFPTVIVFHSEERLPLNHCATLLTCAQLVKQICFL